MKKLKKIKGFKLLILRGILIQLKIIFKLSTHLSLLNNDKSLSKERSISRGIAHISNNPRMKKIEICKDLKFSDYLFTI